MRDQTCEGNEPQERRRTRQCVRRSAQEGRTARLARPRDCPGMRVAERRAKRTRRCMTRPGGERQGGVAQSKLDRRVRRERAGRERDESVSPTPPARRTTDDGSSSRHGSVRSASVERKWTWLNAGSQDSTQTRPPDRATPRHDLAERAKNRKGEPSAGRRSVACSAGDTARRETSKRDTSGGWPPSE